VRINFNSTVETEEGVIECFEANASIAISSSIAIRLVPIDSNGQEYPESASSLVGTLDADNLQELASHIKIALEDLVN
jgi:hypothetical protein